MLTFDGMGQIESPGACAVQFILELSNNNKYRPEFDFALVLLSCTISFRVHYEANAPRSNFYSTVAGITHHGYS